MKKRTIRLAEFATIIYALFVFLSLVIDNAYYSQFNIQIVSYMSVSEILLSGIEGLPKYINPLLSLVASAIFYYIVTIITHFRYGFIRQRYLSLFSPENSIISHFYVATIYNLVSVLVLPIVLYRNLHSIHNLSTMDLYIWMPWIIVPLLIEILLITLLIRVLPSPFYKLRIGETYCSARKYWSLYGVCDNNIANLLLSPEERKLIQYNYRYRYIFPCLLFIAGWFMGQLLENYTLAKEVKESGRHVCVVMDGENLHLDIREGSISYIGECENYIFLYDKNTQGTFIYDRKHIYNYLLITDAIAYTHTKYDQYAESYCTQNTHVLPNILLQIDTISALHTNYSIVIPVTYRLLKQSNNHYIWKDSVTQTYIEQVNLPRDLFKEMPFDGEIFNIDIYVHEREKTEINNIGLCTTIVHSYKGKGGEKAQTVIGDGENYSAWIFYDPIGKHAELGKNILNTICLSGNVWSQMITIYHTNKTGWNIVGIILCVIYVICFVICLFDSYNLKKSFWSNIKEHYWVIWVAVVFFFICYIYMMLSSSHRWFVVTVVFILCILPVFSMISIGTYVCYLKEIIKVYFMQKQLLEKQE